MMLKGLAFLPVEVHCSKVNKVKTAFKSPFFEHGQFLTRYFSQTGK
jgi:hypothetical protein